MVQTFLISHAISFLYYITHFTQYNELFIYDYFFSFFVSAFLPSLLILKAVGKFSGIVPPSS